MYNKKVVILLGVFVSICLNFLGLFSWAFNLQLDLSAWNILEPETFEKKISPIHFKDHGNDFGGLIYFEQGSGGSLGESESIRVNGDTTNTEYNCRQPVEGFYYNEERGERLWPLDEKTALLWGMDDLDLSGGIYTRCILSGREEELELCTEGDLTQEDREQCENDVKKKYRDKYGYYGLIEHKYGGQDMKLVIGTDYKYETDRVVLSGSLEPSLIRIRNTFPVGFVYDYYNGGAGFVGCKVNDSLKDVLNTYNNNKDSNNGGYWNNYFNVNEDLTGLKVIDPVMGSLVECDEKVGSAKDTLLSIVVEGIVGMSKNSNTDGYVGNQSNEKMQLFSSVDVNNTTLINYTKQKAENLCRGKRISASSFSSDTSNIICVNGEDGTRINASDYIGKTLIVKGGVDVIVNPNEDNIYDIFIDSGNLLINESFDPSKTGFVIMKNGFLENDVNIDLNAFYNYSNLLVNLGSAEAVIEMCLNEGRVGVGNVDWRCDFDGNDWVLSADMDILDNIMSRDVAFASVLRGNFIVNGHVMRNNPVDSKLMNKYFIYGKFTTRDSLSDLESVFSWRCNDDGKDTTAAIQFCLDNSLYGNAALSIIDQNYDSPLFK